MATAGTTTTESTTTRGAVDPNRFRHVLGHFCTGVAVIATVEGDTPAGFACQSFSALSLDPPLVLFCPSRASRAWAAIERVGRFTVNLLSSEQREVSAVFGRRGENKFACTGWSLSPGRGPVLDGVLAWIDCVVADVLDGGDHHIVVGRVTDLDTPGPNRPLLFYRGAYAETAEPLDDGVRRWAVEPFFDRPDGWF
ncbi:3-hydroxy-9,10-secoandrosta-1,3,5(10)-triene-9,17-dione monooxygenase reductase subunit [Saccharopolyspora elongata]|uniref:Flavin reductase n=1 Tax=Saccharopolyspora elongata TaxID=2530387 RepID=A0A4R4Y9R1_9PSEU|nr:3-hydroxy-9,10-secoandrosta-1,3,5(10)-triene-9,17-dione monooxygenase reductase subunit [Saccharopolyspora elongata]TDD41261.1 flavin reductase [Saccharopolyspora elongata]